MTTIAAVQGPSWAVVGYDAQVSEADGRKYQLPGDAAKCFEVGDYIVGVAGDFRIVNILSHSFSPPDAPRATGPKLDKFMTTRFIPAIKRAFDNNFYGREGKDDGALLIIVVNGVIYEIGPNFDCIRDTRGLYAIGSGGNFALGAMAALDVQGRRTIKRAQDMVSSAMFVAASLDSGTSEPITLITKKWEE